MLNQKFSNFNSRTNHSRTVVPNLRKCMYKLIIPILIILVFTSCNHKNNLNSSYSKSNLKSLAKAEMDSIKAEKETEIILPEIKMLEYLSLRFNKLEDSTFLSKPDFMIGENKRDTTCGYIIFFKEGHSFKHEQECVEWGEIVTVKFKNTSADQVRKTVEHLFENDTYNWYGNKTEYRPESNYERLWTFKITENEKSTNLEFAYSWI